MMGTLGTLQYLARLAALLIATCGVALAQSEGASRAADDGGEQATPPTLQELKAQGASRSSYRNYEPLLGEEAARRVPG